MNVLSKKHRLFVEAYDGDTVNAMLAAGFVGVPAWLEQQGDKLLNDPLIIEAIKERSRYQAKTFRIIADREERQALLTSWMRNEDPHELEERDANGAPIPKGNLPMQNRIKALELLGKSEGDFVENINHTGNVTFSEMVTKSYQVTESVEDIEAEYNLIREKQARIAQVVEPVKSLLGEFL